MDVNRLIQLKEFYEEDPHDPFNLYALALEFLKIDLKKSRDFFEILLNLHKKYLPTYYHAAKLYLELGEKEKAITVFEDGISLARSLQDTKALRELQSAYDELMFD